MNFLMKTTSVLAVAAAAGMLATSAQAADLGGNCCADLEERVAELEATTARKGNRKVSLQLYGQISEAIIFWDDGSERNAYTVEDNNTKNRFGGRGSAKINSDWSAGYWFEIQLRTGRSSAANQFPLATTEGQTAPVWSTRAITIRQANWWLQSARYGRITVGRQNDTTIGTSSVSLVNPGGFAGPAGAGYAFQGFRLRQAGSTGSQPAALSARNWHSAFLRNGDTILSFDRGPSLHGVNYTSPFFLGHTKSSGFQLSVGWGNDDQWGAALRYAEQFRDIRIAAAVGYHHDGDLYSTNCANKGLQATDSAVDCSTIQVSGSMLHVPTGLYVSAGWAELTDKNRQVAAGNMAGVDNTDDFWYVQAGWQTKLNALGNTIFWGQYVQFNGGMLVDANAVAGLAAGDAINSLAGASLITSRESAIWGGGITQKIDAAAMDLYMGYYRVSTDMYVVANGAASTAGAIKSRPIEDFSVLYTGATIRF